MQEYYTKKIKQIWQKEWEEGIKGKHYFSIQPTLMHTSFTRLERRDSVVITRLRLGHCALNYGLARVGKHLDGRCLCGELETVKHVVMDCEILSAARNRMFSDLLEAGVSSLSLKSILENKEYDATKVVIRFLLHTGLYLRI